MPLSRPGLQPPKKSTDGSSCVITAETVEQKGCPAAFGLHWPRLVEFTPNGPGALGPGPKQACNCPTAPETAHNRSVADVGRTGLVSEGLDCDSEGSLPRANSDFGIRARPFFVINKISGGMWAAPLIPNRFATPGLNGCQTLGNLRQMTNGWQGHGQAGRNGKNARKDEIKWVETGGKGGDGEIRTGRGTGVFPIHHQGGKLKPGGLDD